MKTVFSSHQELCHIWASGSQSYGRASDGRMHFDRDDLYSYSTVIATKVKRGKVSAFVLDTASFSNSTSKHQNHAGRATSGEVFYVRLGRRGRSMIFTPQSLRDHYLAEYAKPPEVSRYKRINMERLVARHEYLEQARRVCVVFGLSTLKTDRFLTKSYAEVEAANQFLETDRAAKAEKQRIMREAGRLRMRNMALEYLAANSVRDAADFQLNRLAEALEGCAELGPVSAEIMLRNAQKLANWKAGLPEMFGCSVPIQLRVKDGRIETTNQAIIPYESGERCYRFVNTRRTKGWHANGEKFAVGPYALSEVNEREIVVGCHHISWDVIDAFAQEQGWVKESLTGKQKECAE